VTLTVAIRNNYGQRAVYPACETSRKLAALVGAKTFTDRVIDQLKGLGYVFTVKQETI